MCFAPTKKTAFEEILEHCTETGIDSFLPLITQRTQANYLAHWARKKARFKQIILSASKQSERGFIPKLVEPKKFKEIFTGEEIVFFASPDGNTLQDCGVDFKNIGAAKLVIGPEGGFTPGETAFAEGEKAVLIKISKHILRSETAAIAASSLLLNIAE